MKLKKAIALFMASLITILAVPINGLAEETTTTESTVVAPGTTTTLDVTWSRSIEYGLTNSPVVTLTDKSDDAEADNVYRSSTEFRWDYSDVLSSLYGDNNTNTINVTSTINEDGTVNDSAIWDYMTTNQYCGSAPPYSYTDSNNETVHPEGATWSNGDSGATARLFRAEFEWPEGYDLKDTLRIVSVNEKADRYDAIYEYLENNGLTEYTNEGKKIIAINDDMFVFIHTDNDTITSSNYNQYFVFWSGTTATEGITYNNKTAANAFHDVMPNDTTSTATEAYPAQGFTNTYMAFSNGWYTFVNPSGLSTKLLTNNNDSKEIQAGTKVYIDFVCFDRSGYGGMDKLEIEIEKRQPKAQTVTVNYYLDTVEAGSLLGTSYMNNIIPGEEVELSSGTDYNQLNHYYNVAAQKTTSGKTVENGIQVNKLIVQEDAENVVNVLYRTDSLEDVSFVIDYAKEVTLTEEQVFADELDNLRTDDRQVTVTLGENNIVTGTYGEMKLESVSSNDNETATYNLLYNLKRFISGIDTYSLNVSVSDSTGENELSKVSKIVNMVPANNVYYEDTFVTNSSTGTIGIEYSGTWSELGTTSSNSSNSVNKDNKTGTYDDVYGWEEDLAKNTNYSDGTAHFATYEQGKQATATFTFTGTGVDIYSRTDLSTGTVVATLIGKKTADNKQVGKVLVVDNLAASVALIDGYYQIPTLFFNNLEHGTYTVTITVTDGAASEGRNTYYLDGIRVYNPLKNIEQDAANSSNTLVKTVYEAANEDGAYFESVRKILIDKNNQSYVASGATANVTGAVFIDQKGSATDILTGTIDEYEDLGPKNEVYLAGKQSIVFHVDPNAHYYIGLKSPTGNATAAITNGTADTMKTISVTASDLYYEVVPDAKGYIVITNEADQDNTDVLLSVTKLRTTGLDFTSGVREITIEEGQNVATASYSLRRISSDIIEDDTDTPGDIEITNPDNQETNNTVQENVIAALKKLVKEIFTSFHSWFKR